MIISGSLNSVFLFTEAYAFLLTGTIAELLTGTMVNFLAFYIPPGLAQPQLQDYFKPDTEQGMNQKIYIQVKK